METQTSKLELLRKREAEIRAKIAEENDRQRKREQKEAARLPYWLAPHSSPTFKRHRQQRQWLAKFFNAASNKRRTASF